MCVKIHDRTIYIYIYIYKQKKTFFVRFLTLRIVVGEETLVDFSENVQQFTCLKSLGSGNGLKFFYQ